MSAINSKTKTHHYMAAFLGLSMVAAFAAPYATPSSAAALKSGSFSDPAFERVWSRTDKPVEERKAARSWMWGPEGYYSTYEPYVEGPGGQHLVTYFDKSRMEINQPAGDRNSQWYVTNGLLVVDMMSGKIQTGNNSFAPFHPNNSPVAGDAKTSLNAPTYASLAKVASLQGDKRAPNRSGQPIIEGLGRNGNVALLQNLSGFSKYGVYEPTLGHNIADVFWSFMNQRGPVFQDGRYTDSTVVDWLFAMGYPITEPYWIEINVGGQNRWVLMQAFQRRILTYSPYNPEGWKVEMANVGRAYFDWRYSGQGQPVPPPPAQPTPTPAPAPAASLGINPNSGDLNTVINVSGKGFPANVNVTLLVENTGANYQRNLGVAGTNNRGEFSTQIRVPGDSSRLGEVRITAVNGGQRVSQTYKLVFDPQIKISPERSVANGGTIRVNGTGFIAKASGRVGILVNDSNMVWLNNIGTNDQGNFETTLGIGRWPVNTVLQVIANTDGNQKAVSGKLTVYEAPVNQSVSINPNVLAPGQITVVTGGGWKPGTVVGIGLGYKDLIEWVAQSTADANGNVSTSFKLGQRWANGGQLTVFAVGPEGKYATTTLTVVGSSSGGPVVPQGLDMRVSSYNYNGQTIYKIRGFGWSAGQQVNLNIWSPDGAINANVGGGTVKNDGSFQIDFPAAGPWFGRSDLGLRATAPNGALLSVRFVPAMSVAASTVPGNSHAFTGLHLPSNTPVEVVVHIDGQGDKTIGSGVTDAIGNVVLNVASPRIPSQNKNDFEFRTKDGQYSAIFDY